jgi:hypothetical protein
VVVGHSKVPEPAHTFEDAAAAVAAIRDRRAQHRPPDPDLQFYPSHVVDDDDVDAAIDYLYTRARVPREVRRAELEDRALLLSYQRQRDQRRRDARLLDLLDTAVAVGAPPSGYGCQLGLSRQNACNLRTRLRARLTGTEVPATAAAAAAEEDQARRLATWLTQHRAELHDVGEQLVDRVDQLAALLDRVAGGVDELRAAVAAIEEHLPRTPSRVLVVSVSYAAWLLRPDGPAASPDDPALRDLIGDALRLRTSFDQFAG